MSNGNTRMENEIVLLKSITGLIDDMVNHSMILIEKFDDGKLVKPHTRESQRIFNIMLVDFLSKPDSIFTQNYSSYLDALCSISNNPLFNTDSSVNDLRSATKSFFEWLSEDTKGREGSVEPLVEVWFPNIDYSGYLKISRQDFIIICGNLSKHSLLRQTIQAKKLYRILKESGLQNVTREDSLLALEDFYGRFYDDILNYHLGTICEFLNEIQWGIYTYLSPEFCRSYTKFGNSIQYKYRYPADVESRFARACYWELMNWIRRGPIMARFQISKWCKKRY